MSFLLNLLVLALTYLIVIVEQIEKLHKEAIKERNTTQRALGPLRKNVSNVITYSLCG